MEFGTGKWRDPEQEVVFPSISSTREYKGDTLFLTDKSFWFRWKFNPVKTEITHTTIWLDSRIKFSSTTFFLWGSSKLTEVENVLFTDKVGPSRTQEVQGKLNIWRVRVFTTPNLFFTKPVGWRLLLPWVDGPFTRQGIQKAVFDSVPERVRRYRFRRRNLGRQPQTPGSFSRRIYLLRSWCSILFTTILASYKPDLFQVTAVLSTEIYKIFDSEKVHCDFPVWPRSTSGWIPLTQST